MAATYFGPFRATGQKTSQTGLTTYQRSVNVRLVTDDLLVMALDFASIKVFHQIAVNHQPSFIRTQNTWPCAVPKQTLDRPHLTVTWRHVVLGRSTPSSGKTEYFYVTVGEIADHLGLKIPLTLKLVAFYITSHF